MSILKKKVQSQELAVEIMYVKFYDETNDYALNLGEKVSNENLPQSRYKACMLYNH